MSTEALVRANSRSNYSQHPSYFNLREDGQQRARDQISAWPNHGGVLPSNPDLTLQDLECSHCRKLFKKSKDHRVQAWKGFCALTLQRLRRKLYPSPAILCAELALDCTSCPSAILDSKIALLNLRIS